MVKRVVLFLGLLCSFASGDISNKEFISKPIIVNTSNVTLDGQNKTLILKDDSNCPMIIVGDPNFTEPKFEVENITIRNYILDGNKDNQPDEIYTTHKNSHTNFMRNNIINVRGAKNVIIENCIIRNARSGGICIEKSSSKVIIRNCVISNSQFDGIAGYISDSCEVYSNVIINNKAAGFSFDLNFNNCKLYENTIIDNDIGIFIRDCKNITIEKNVIFNKVWDFYVNQTDEDKKTLPENIQYMNNKHSKVFVLQKVPIE